LEARQLGQAGDVSFIFGVKAMPNVVEQAEELPESAWKRLARPPRYQVKTEERQKPVNVKERIVREREYKNLALQYEDVAEFNYSPTCCKGEYRVVALRKKISVEKGQEQLFEEYRYFFYITMSVTCRSSRSSSRPTTVATRRT